MADFGSDQDASGLPELTSRDDIIWFLEQNDVLLPDGLTVEKIKRRGSWYVIDDDSFSFRVERHPSGPFSSRSPTGRSMPTPARWHVRTRYTFDLTTSQWEVTEFMREFDFNPMLLVDAEFDQPAKKELWDEAIARVQTADNPEAVLEEEFTATEEFYGRVFPDVPEDQLAKMLTVLRQEFRRRAGLE